MKYLLKFLLRSYLKIAAKLVLFRNKPVIIAVAGSLNKSFIKDSVSETLEKNGWSVGKTINNFNTDIGMSLSILGLASGYNSYKNWWPIIKAVPGKILTPRNIDVLILEYGSSDPGDMKFLLSITQPTITIIGEITKRYLESFGSIDGLTKEYQCLVNNTLSTGLVVLNSDNIKVANLSSHAKARVETFGINSKADYKLISSEIINNGIKIFGENRRGVKKEFYTITYGQQHIYATLAAWAVEDCLGGKNEKN